MLNPKSRSSRKKSSSNKNGGGGLQLLLWTIFSTAFFYFWDSKFVFNFLPKLKFQKIQFARHTTKLTLVENRSKRQGVPEYLGPRIMELLKCTCFSIPCFSANRSSSTSMHPFRSHSFLLIDLDVYVIDYFFFTTSPFEQKVLWVTDCFLYIFELLIVFSIFEAHAFCIVYNSLIFELSFPFPLPSFFSPSYIGSRTSLVWTGCHFLFSKHILFNVWYLWPFFAFKTHSVYYIVRQCKSQSNHIKFVQSKKNDYNTKQDLYL